MIDVREIVIQEKQRGNYTQSRIVPLREANVEKFSAREIAVVDDVIKALCGLNATETSEYSHLEIGWRVAGFKETIPYETAFISSETATPIDKIRAKELALEYGW